MEQHWHGYGWSGRERAESKFQEGRVPPDDLPCREIKHYLLKHRNTIKGTFKAPAEAVEWLAGELAAYPHPESYGLTDEDRLRFAESTLNQERGNDLAFGWYSGGVYVSRVLVACPRPEDKIKCPEGL